MREALRLRRIFEYVGDRTGIHIEVILTDGKQPVGHGIGPVLEARDVMKVLRNEIDAPGDLRQKSLRLAGRIIEFDPDVRGGQGYAIARDILDSGRALEKFNAIIQHQGKPPKSYTLGALTFDVHARESGVVTAIDNFLLAKIARMAGAPMDKGAGVDLFKKIGDKVKKGDAIYRVYAEFPTDLEFARDLSNTDDGYSIGDAVNDSQFSFSD
jgi:thymidine phosphorylase